MHMENYKCTNGDQKQIKKCNVEEKDGREKKK
jgi:hypothetical protein